ncbi:MAG TPA: TPM domain-containing protein [Usitatibacter sp.]|nr:TPM domain-containing protein [Usitatibacter sp.]
MELKRFFRHVMMTPATAARAFPSKTLDAIQHEIAAHEKRHRGEVCFVVEGELTTAQLWAGLTSRQRAKEVFAAQGVWNTEENNGVLIYVLLAEHRVEIVADRGIDRKVGEGEWRAIVDSMDGFFREGRYEEGAVAGVRSVSQLLERHFPASGDGTNELGDRPVIL